MELRRFTRLSKTCHIAMFEYLRWWSCSWKVLFSRCGKCKYTVCLKTNSANLISQLDPCQGWLTYQYMSCHISVSGELQNMTSYIYIYIIYISYIYNIYIYIYINFWWSPFYHILFIYHRSLQIYMPKMFVNQVVGRHLSRPKNVQAFGAGLRALGLEWDAQPSMTCHDWDPV